MTDDSLKTAWQLAAQHPGNPLSASVQLLVDEVARLKTIVNGLAARVAAQSEMLTRRAERPAATTTNDGVPRA